MPAVPLDDDLFEQALGAYEGIMKAKSGSVNQDAAHQETLRQVDGIYAGFRARYEAFEEEQRNSVQLIRLGSLIRKDGGRPDWYGGAKTSVGKWPDYRGRLEGDLPEQAVKDIHGSTERILSRVANPKAVGDRRKGLVIGYVQSGKTANFTGVIAKAVDEGYRIIIILAGMYTNLRVQTQIRLDKDLELDKVENRAGLTWYKLTSSKADIGTDNSPGAISGVSNVAVIVVKKHEKRLTNVTDFLNSVPEDTLKRRPVLIIDDESDQATPNTLASKDLVSTINRRIRDLWAAVPTGTYVAYTATPFANVFIDPSDDEDMYPEDFISVLPKPDGYMGSELFFDVAQNADSDEDEAIHQLAREVPDEQARVFTPRPKEIDDFSPEMTPTLETAVRWFILATAIRELRTGVKKDSSMLVHTSQRVRVHQLTKEVISSFISAIALEVEEQEELFRDVFEKEKDQAVSLRDGEEMPGWEDVWAKTMKVLENVLVKIDNGESDDRLVYEKDKPQTVIAVGGGTLSRGLTLEGLVVSYFLRSSNTYDTLLQMGRWFGFRPRYRDLVRVWMGPGLREDYAHLARVEKELRDEVEEMEKESRTPRDFAVKVRSHPGRLEITAKSKMDAAQLVRAGLGGTRRQTIYLDRSEHGIETGQRAASRLVQRAVERGGQVLERSARSGNGRPTVMYQGLRNSDIVDFLDDYWVAPSDRWLQAPAMQGWLDRHGRDTRWNLVLVSGPKGETHEYADGVAVGLSSRTPLKEEYWTPDRLDGDLPAGSDVVNIRALMSGEDYVVDLRILADQGLLDADDLRVLDGVDKSKAPQMKAARALIRPSEGTIVLYAIDGASEPDPRSTAKTQTRTAMGASGTMIGLGVVFPHAPEEDPGEYWAVPLEDEDAEGTVELVDDEGDYVNEDEGR